MKINFRKLKQNLTTNQIIEIVESLGANVYSQNNQEVVFYSCCHHLLPMEHKPKLYYYIDTQSFFCYSCSSAFDIIALVRERWRLENKDFTFMDIVDYIMRIAGIELESVQRLVPRMKENVRWQDILGKYSHIKNNESPLKKWDKHILDFFEEVYPLDWVEEGISLETMYHYNIKYYRLRNQTVIPCYDEHNDLVGIRVRNWQPQSNSKYDSLKTLADFETCSSNKDAKKQTEIYGTDFKFPTNRILYGLNVNQYAIEAKKKVIIVESEKAVLKSHTWYGHNSIATSLFGSFLNNKRRNMLLKKEIDEVIIVPDYDYASTKNKTSYTRWWDKQMKIAQKFAGFCPVSIVMNYKNYVPHKDNAFDVSKTKFEILMAQRQNIFELNERKNK